MGRSVDPERIYLARRAGLVVRLTRVARLSDAMAERSVAQWEKEAAGRGLDRHSSAFWEPAWEWISSRRGGQP